MKCILIAVLLTLAFSSCKRDEYFGFTGKQLDLVNYTKDQVIHFIDTNAVKNTLHQRYYRRDYRETIGILGGNGQFTEEYVVSYSPITGNTVSLSISQYMLSKAIILEFCGYSIAANIDSLFPSRSAIPIEGISYSDVYTIKVYKGDALPGNHNTATLYHNRKYGVIQLLFPNGKRIVRTD